eukprot:s2634_g6.t1
MASTPLQDVQSMFQHMDVEKEMELLKRGQAAPDDQALGKEDQLQVSSSSPKGLSRDRQGPGFGLVLGGPSPGDGGSSDCSGCGDQHSGSARGWKWDGGDSQLPRQGPASVWMGRTARNGRQYDQSLEENVRLIARLCLRHEDELSQMRVERDFVLTMETQGLGRQTAGLGCHNGRSQGPEGADHRAGTGLSSRGTDGAPLVVHEVGPLEFLRTKLADLEPLKQSQIIASLQELQTVITAPNVLQRFHSTRRMASAYEGETVTFLLSVGLRDPKSAQAWGLLTNLCGNSSGKVIGLRMRATRMDRQPLAKVVSERFPPPATRRSGNQAQEAEDRPAAMEAESKPVEKDS